MKLFSTKHDNTAPEPIPMCFEELSPCYLCLFYVPDDPIEGERFRSDGGNGMCRRYPTEAPVSFDYGCGEWQHRRLVRDWNYSPGSSDATA